MPELPELEIYCENLKPLIVGKTVCSATVREQDFNRLKGGWICDIIRYGKELFFYMQDGFCFSVHLMLGGKFAFCHQVAAEQTQNKIAELDFENGNCLLIVDRKGLVKIRCDASIEGAPDAMMSGFTLSYFLSGISNDRRRIKTVLTDQNFVRGIGNAYADEILYTAKVHPDSIAFKIPEQSAILIYRSVGKVLKDAISEIKKAAPSIISGERRDFMKVHGKHGSTSDGEKIFIKTLASKQTFFTSSQILYV